MSGTDNNLTYNREAVDTAPTTETMIGTEVVYNNQSI